MVLLRGLKRSRDNTQFHVRITSDEDSESGVGEVVSEISGPTRNHFASKNYGDGLRGICVVLMCRNPALNFKKRIRFSSVDERLYMDIMLDLPEMQSASPATRKSKIYQRIITEVPEVVGKYKFSGFNEPRFSEDLKEWFNSLEKNPADQIARI